MLSNDEILIRIVFSLVVGLIIGLERELAKGKGYAGLRTHALVALGSTIFTLASLSIGEDPGRIAAGVVTGIGFLGAGLIFREKGGLYGLTSAANIWVVSAIGLAIGLGMYILAIYSTVLVIFVLVIGKLFEKKIIEKKIKKDVE